MMVTMVKIEVLMAKAARQREETVKWEENRKKAG